MTAQRRRGVPKMLPREPLTQKAWWAIWTYAQVRAEKSGPIGALMCKYILTAERMRRVDLYAYLDGRGYRWAPSTLWRKGKR